MFKLFTRQDLVPGTTPPKRRTATPTASQFQSLSVLRTPAAAPTQLSLFQRPGTAKR
jgi:hypothetical protein